MALFAEWSLASEEISIIKGRGRVQRVIESSSAKNDPDKTGLASCCPQNGISLGEKQ